MDRTCSLEFLSVDHGQWSSRADVSLISKETGKGMDGPLFLPVKYFVVVHVAERAVRGRLPGRFERAVRGYSTGQFERAIQGELSGQRWLLFGATLLVRRLVTTG